MGVTASQIDEIATWCQLTPELERERQEAWHRFFDEEDPRPTRYWPGAGDHISRARRFVGWFMFDHALHEGDRPAARAVRALYPGAVQEEALRAIAGTRFVLAIVASVLPGRSVLLEVENERFEIRERGWSRRITPQASVSAHLVPVGRRQRWLVGPGWLEWPIRIGTHMQRDLRRFQVDPLAIERLLQSRTASDETPRPPQDATLDEAVARMTAAAGAAGAIQLIMSVGEWQALVTRHLVAADATAFSQEILGRAGNSGSIEDLNQWLQLAMNIWNTTPQPDRGGKTAYELARRAGAETS